jgi:hypothetical protein
VKSYGELFGKHVFYYGDEEGEEEFESDSQTHQTPPEDDSEESLYTTSYGDLTQRIASLRRFDAKSHYTTPKDEGPEYGLVSPSKRSVKIEDEWSDCSLPTGDHREATSKC